MTSVENIEKGIAAASNLSRETGHPGKDIRPCIATLIESALVKGDYPNRSEAAVVIATEFRRIGLHYEEALKRLTNWNQFHNPPLRPSELRKAASNGYTKDYNYSCRHNVLSAYCVDESTCPFCTKVVGKKGRNNDMAFIDYGWQNHLTKRQVLLYLVALPYLEKTRRIGKGGLICANYRQIADAAGIPQRRLGDDLRTLAAVGLIEFQAGEPRKWEGIASEIRRVFPIPRPTRESLRIIKKGKMSP